MGVACPSGSKSTIYGFKECIENHWNDDDFVILSRMPSTWSHAMGIVVLWTAPKAFSLHGNHILGDRCPARGSSGATLLLLSSAEAGSHCSHR